MEECEPEEPAEVEVRKLPLCEAIRSEAEKALTEIEFETPYEWGVKAGIELTLQLNDKHFAALSVEEVARVLSGFGPQSWERLEQSHRDYWLGKAQAVMRLLRGE